jgi:hypothetical protein
LPPKGPTALLDAWTSPQTKKNHLNDCCMRRNAFKIPPSYRTMFPNRETPYGMVNDVSTRFGYWYGTQGVVSCNIDPNPIHISNQGTSTYLETFLHILRHISSLRSFRVEGTWFEAFSIYLEESTLHKEMPCGLVGILKP